MRYRDTGTQDPTHALATWFEQMLSEDVTELRLQSGYFSFDAVRAISGLLKKAAAEDRKTYIVLGSNDGDTLHSDVSRLALKLGVPRANAHLAVVRFGNALFHPKVYHVTRSDGSQAAFVGSANFTGPGLTGSNVEAAFSVDTREGDPQELLEAVRFAIDRWFGIGPEGGVFCVHSQSDIDALLESGVLAHTRPPRPAAPGGGAGVKSIARRQKLVKLPPWVDEEEGGGVNGGQSDDDEPAALEAVIAAEPAPEGFPPPLGVLEVAPHAGDADLLPSEERDGFPPYVRFAPGIAEPTSGWSGLSGLTLQQPFVGLILRLTKDSARHFKGGEGTANISIPVGVARTFRFGVLPRSGRPRAEFQLRVRYYSDTLVVERDTQTNVMAYGYLPGEKGHGDLRLLVPTAVRQVAKQIEQEGQALPSEGDLFLLEWPNSETDSFGLTFLHADTDAARQAKALYAQAEVSQTLFGAACWLPPDLVPPWQ